MNLRAFLDLFLHLDKNLAAAVTNYGPQIYAILFVIVFCETGLVFLPFLPGDSLLFTAGALAGRGLLSAGALYPLFVVAALLGDNVNYWVGRKLGRKLFESNTSRVFKRANLERTEAFFAKYGGKAIVLARFVPIVRTFAPFVAGTGAMPYARFLTYSIGGALLWVGVCVTAGLLFGNIEAVKKHFELVVLGVVLVSLLPMVFEYMAHRRSAKAGVGASGLESSGR